VCAVAKCVFFKNQTRVVFVTVQNASAEYQKDWTKCMCTEKNTFFKFN